MSYLVEQEYLNIMKDINWNGVRKEGRNGAYYSIPFPQLSWDMSGGFFPLITTRKMFYKGVLGEYAAMIRGPKHIEDFRKWGCNFWDAWAEEDGSINVDYGNAWRDYNGVNQMEYVLDALTNNPGDRRMVIDAWRPDRLTDLSLPCCHYSYQFWSDGETISLLWNQRSADWCVGVPSDMVFASVMLLCFAQLSGSKPGKVVMQFGDAHIYEEHMDQAHKQSRMNPWFPPKYRLSEQEDLYSFQPADLYLEGYQHEERLSYELKD